MSWSDLMEELVVEHGSQARLARLLKMDDQRISSWRRGTSVRVAAVAQVAKALRRPLPDLLAVAYDIPPHEMADQQAVLFVLEHDPTLDDDQRLYLVATYRLMQRQR